MPFTLTRLPCIPLEMILQQIEPVQVLELTMASRRVKNLISQQKRTKLTVTELRFTCEMKNDKVTLSMTIYFLPHPSFIRTFQADFVFYSIRKVEVCKAPTTPSRQRVKTITRRVNGRKLPIDFRSQKFYMGAYSENVISAMEHLTIHMLSILNVRECNLYALGVMDFENFFLFKHVRKFTSCIIYEPDFLKSDVNFVLENIETTRGITFMPISNSTDSTSCFPIRSKKAILSLERGHVSFETFENISFSCVLNMKCETLNIMDGSKHVSAQKLISFLKKWVSGGHSQLDEFYVGYLILSRLEQHKLRWKVFKAIRKLKNVNVIISENTRTIQRTDGMRVKIVFKEYFEMKVI